MNPGRPSVHPLSPDAEKILTDFPPTLIGDPNVNWKPFGSRLPEGLLKQVKQVSIQRDTTVQAVTYAALRHWVEHPEMYPELGQ